MALTFIVPASGVAINKPVTGTQNERFPIRVTNDTSAPVTWNPSVVFNSNGVGLSVIPENTGRVIPVGESALVGFQLSADISIAGSIPPTLAELQIDQTTADGTFATTVNIYLTAYSQEDEDINDNTARYEIDKARLSYEATAKSQHQPGFGMYIFTDSLGDLIYWPDTGGGSGGTETWPANTKFVSPSWRNRTPDGQNNYYDPIYSTPAKALAAIKATNGYETQDWTIVVYNRANTNYTTDTLELDNRITLLMVHQAVYAGVVRLKDKACIAGDGVFTGTVVCSNDNPLDADYGLNYIDAQSIATLHIDEKSVAQVNVRTVDTLRYSSTYAHKQIDKYSVLEIQKAKKVFVEGQGCCILQNCMVRPDTAIPALTYVVGTNNFFIENCCFITEYGEAIVTNDASGAELKCLGNSTAQAAERKYKFAPHYSNNTITQVAGSIEFVKTVFPST